MRTTIHVLEEGMRDGSASAGGINWRTFAKDGEISYSGHHPTWVFASFVQMALPLRTCWLIHLPFHLLSNTIMKIPTWQQKTKRDLRLLFKSVTVSAVSAFGCLFRRCRTSPPPSARDIQGWNT